MSRSHLWSWVGFVCLACAAGVFAQQDQPAGDPSSVTASSAVAAVPRLIKFSGMLRDLTGKPLTGPVDVGFAIYKEQADLVPLWHEVQTVQLDEQGRYTVLLGAMQAEGLPMVLFTSGEARWLGVEARGAEPQPRTLLVSVPYALKAGDAETLGGKPASAFLVAAPVSSLETGSLAASSQGAGEPVLKLATGGKTTPLLTSGTVNYLGKFTSTTDLGNSVLYESGGKIGLGTTTPASALDVVGNNAGLRLTGTGTHQVTVTGVSSGRLGQDSVGFFFASDTNGKALRFYTNNGVLNEWFRITSAGNVGIGTVTPAQKLDVAGSVRGTQLISTVASGTAPLSVTSNTLVLNLNADLLDGVHASAFQPAGTYAILGANTFTTTQSISSGDLSVSSGDISLPQTTSASAGVINLGGAPFIHACCSASQNNTFVGSTAGNFTTTGSENTASGYGALWSNTTGSYNTASGSYALRANTTGMANTASGWKALYKNTNAGSGNTASGYYALYSNTTGQFNTAFGYQAGFYSTTGSNNMFVGYNAGPDSGHGALTNATAIGYNAVVTASNALVLGGTGVDAVNVGIGTTAPAERLEVGGNLKASGSVTATSFSGSGSALTALNASSLASGTVPSAVVSGTYSNAVTFNNASNTFSGNGSGLTNVSAATATTAATATNALSLGGILASYYPTTNMANSFSATQFITDTATNGTGVVGQADNGSAAWGVYGRSTQGIGIYGYSNDAGAIGGLFVNWTSGGKALSAKVAGTETFNADANGIHAGPGMTSTPIAYGNFAANGARNVGSSNLSCTWNALSTWYVCTVTGESLNYDDHIYSVVPANAPLMPSIDAVGTSVLVIFYNVSGSKAQTPYGFSLTIFKP